MHFLQPEKKKKRKEKGKCEFGVWDIIVLLFDSLTTEFGNPKRIKEIYLLVIIGFEFQ